MEKLESLKKFQSQSLNQAEMKNVYGGVAAAPTATGAGSWCTVASSTGCMGYASDKIDGETTYYYGIYEVAQAC